MTTHSFTKSETALLVEAAERGGAFVAPSTMKPSTTQRLVGKLLRDGLIELGAEQDGKLGHLLTYTGYGAVGLTPPRRPRTAGPAAPSGSKRELVLGLLGRGEGASLAELIAATGWLPHTTRAALSRLRSAGQVLLKSTRQDGCTAYRIQVSEPKPRGRVARKRPPQAEAAAV